MTSVKNGVLLVLAVILFGSGTTTLCSGENIQPGKVYKSPKHIFIIVAPNPTGFDVHAWRVDYESMKGNHEMVTFYDIDFGETYRAGVAEFYKSDADLDTAAKASAVTRKHQIGEPIELVEESKVQTQFGEGSLRVYSMKGGRYFARDSSVRNGRHSNFRIATSPLSASSTGSSLTPRDPFRY